MTDYRFDVFLSYHRGQRLEPGGEWPLGPDGRWVHDVFYPEFKHWLGEEYPGVRIAFDRDLEPGVPWDATLKRWVCESKCMVAVWNAPYFMSRYCRSEFHSMLGRQKRLAGVNGEGPRLVVPVVYADGKWFDPDARAIEFSKNFSVYSKYVRPIMNEEARAGFVTAMQDLCRSVAHAIERAPAFEVHAWCDMEPLPAAHAYPVPTLQQ
jgi:hypothetical protein